MSRKPRTRREILHEIVFEAHTPAGLAFDIVLIVMILSSVLTVMLESVSSIRARFGSQLVALEWFFTILFTIEYGLRLAIVNKKLRWARSFFPVVDLLALLPTYLSLVFHGTQALLIFRVVRLIRIFRVMGLSRFVGESRLLWTAVKGSMRKITVFLGVVLTVVMSLGALMYVIEGDEGGFTSIPQGVYWAVVTLTTVGYGDVAPVTPLGKLVASFVMILGYGILAVPTGIVSVELAEVTRQKGQSKQSCPGCGALGHDPDAVHCKFCGATL